MDSLIYNIGVWFCEIWNTITSTLGLYSLQAGGICCNQAQQVINKNFRLNTCTDTYILGWIGLAIIVYAIYQAKNRL